MERASCFKDATKKVESITSIASKRGFFFQTADIYGGKAGFFTYGHLGKSIKNKFENLWRKYYLDENCYEIQSNNILPENVFIASGHVENFNDPLTECKSCHFRFRVDQFLEDKGIEVDSLSIENLNNKLKKNKLKCPRCGGELSDVKQFNMMFPVNVGFAEEKAYLSPETAQASYLAFKQEFEATRKKLPLGIAIIDKAYRNEISPRQLFFRLREFTQAELQIFFDSEEMNKLEDEKWNKVKDYKIITFQKGKLNEISCSELNSKQKIPKLYAYNMAKVQKFYLELLQVPKSKFRLRELGEDERAFYNKIHFDVELCIESIGGFKEVAGIHYRTDHDLKGHEKQSKKNLHVFYNNKQVLCHVLELSFGVDRNIWALLDLFYKEEKVENETRQMFSFPYIIAPEDVAIFPLVNKDGLPEIAEQIYEKLKKEFSCIYDDSGSIGRRYRRQDEIGTKYCITVDGDTKKDKTVTVRDRDTMKQVRIKIDNLAEHLNK